MSATYRVIAFSGSLRSASTNSGLVRLAQRVAPAELEVEIIEWLTELPWMNPDIVAAVTAKMRAVHDALHTRDAVGSV